MGTVKASQKLFTYTQVVNLTGICVEHLHKIAKNRHLGFIERAACLRIIQLDRMESGGMVAAGLDETYVTT
jgi:hypothetical protein